MTEPVRELNLMLRDREFLVELMRLEKQRRGASPDDLTFLGTRNIADYKWCSMQSVLESRRDETMFFKVWLTDRIRYALELGLENRLPETNEALLTVGQEITSQDIDALLGMRAERERKRSSEAHGDGLENTTDRAIDPFAAGRAAARAHAERYGTIRWSFRWDRYSIITMPDGITNEFVYEFKSTRYRRYLGMATPPARAQAELYALCFGRERLRLQFFVREDESIETLECPADREAANALLRDFTAVADGQPPPLPVWWKCRSCKLKESCPVGPISRP